MTRYIVGVLNTIHILKYAAVVISFPEVDIMTRAVMETRILATVKSVVMASSYPRLQPVVIFRMPVDNLRCDSQLKPRLVVAAFCIPLAQQRIMNAARTWLHLNTANKSVVSARYTQNGETRSAAARKLTSQTRKCVAVARFNQRHHKDAQG